MAWLSGSRQEREEGSTGAKPREERAGMRCACGRRAMGGLRARPRGSQAQRGSGERSAGLAFDPDAIGRHTGGKPLWGPSCYCFSTFGFSGNQSFPRCFTKPECGKARGGKARRGVCGHMGLRITAFCPPDTAPPSLPGNSVLRDDLEHCRLPCSITPREEDAGPPSSGAVTNTLAPLWTCPCG